MCASWSKIMRTISVGYLHFGAEVWMWKHKLWDLVSPFQLHQLHDPFSITVNFRYLPSTKTPTSGRKPDDYVGVQFYPWFKFYFPLFFKLIIIYYKTQKQKKIKFEPRIKLNHNNYEPRAQIKQMFQEGELKQGIKRQSRRFLKNTLFQKRLLQI